MRLSIAIAAAACLITLQGCDAEGSEAKSASAPAAMPAAGSASVMIADAAGAPKGRATIMEMGGGLHLVAEITGMAPGSYGVHLHMVGKCEAPGFTTAGSHWNPMQKMHGSENPQGPHFGDLPNVVIGADGTGRIDATIPGATLAGGATALLDADGAALVVHAGPDDYKTDPTGNSGARIACGVVTPG